MRSFLENQLKKKGYGRIVNVSSGGSIHFMTGGGTPAYISKVAINALTRILAAEVRNTNIDPGWVDTDM